MAATLKVSARMVFTPSAGPVIEISSGEISVASALGEQWTGDIMDIGTAEEAVRNTDSTDGWLYCRNLDTTNFITLKTLVSATYYPFAKMFPGEFAFFRIGSASNAIYAIADTAACKMQVLCIANA